MYGYTSTQIIKMKQSLLVVALLIALLMSSCKKSSDNINDPITPDPPGNADQVAIPAVDNAVATFMSNYAIPGVSIAVVKNEHLVYLKSYGKMSASDNTPINNNSLFRIASVSKPLTAVGILKLLEANQLTLDSKVFGTNGILGNDYPSVNLAAVSDITVGQLLHHTSGAWPNDGTDPMFQQPTFNHAQLIKWTLDNYPAGNRGVYKYSNFGYCVLGRVIEKLSGKPYEQFIKDEVLTPSGITTMRIGGSTLAQRLPNEVLYTGQGGSDPYVFDFPRMDSHGGWVATAKDLARFIVHVDGFNGVADILRPATITTMSTAAPASDYACGWSVNSANNWWHTGGLPGTATEIVRASNGFNWVILLNTRSVLNGFDGAMDNLLWPAVSNASTPWQNIDQF